MSLFKKKHPSKSHSIPSQIKDTPPLFYKEKSPIPLALDRRAAWLAATIGSATIIPIGLVSGLKTMLTGHFTKGLHTIGYSFATGIGYTAISGTSIIAPRIGAHYAKKNILDTHQLYRKLPIDGFNQLDPIKYPSAKYTIKALDVYTDKGKLDAIEISPTLEPTDAKCDEKIIIKFCGAGHNYQEVAPYILDDVMALKCTVIVANYPGVSTPSYRIKYNGDLFNVGIALLHDTVKRKNLTNEQAAQNIILEGYSLGGGVVMNTLAHYKKHFGVDFKGFINRSYWSISKDVGAFFHRFLGLPVSYGEGLQKIYYYGSGGFDINSKKLYEQLTPTNIDYFNVENDIVIPRGVAFTDATKNDIADHYFKWNGEGDPDVKITYPLIEHTAPNHTLFHPKKNVDARDYFRLFAHKAWNKTGQDPMPDISKSQHHSKHYPISCIVLG